MNDPIPKIPANRIVVMMPNWLGDGVMATPFLRALRSLYSDAHIAAIARPLVAPVLTALPFVNDLHVLDKSNQRATLRYLRENHFDLGILLPNSFRSAWTLFRGGVKRRLGYAREWRRPLLTDSIFPMRRSLKSYQTQEARRLFRNQTLGIEAITGKKELISIDPPTGRRCSYRRTFQYTQATIDTPVRDSIGQFSDNLYAPALGHWMAARRGFEPVPTIDYYLKLAEYLGAQSPSKQMQLAIIPEEKAQADQALALAGISDDDPLVVIVPGANFGASKCWLPERFAQVADRIMDRPERGGTLGAHVLLASSPAELPLVDAILAASLLCPNGGGIGRLHALAKMNNGKGLPLGALKEIVRRSKLMLCNDTGPRHFAAAFNIPTVTLFGPTDPVWAETYSTNERLVRIDVPCGPCQLKTCPIDHRCMKGLTVEMVMAAITDLWHNQQEKPTPDIDPRSDELTT